MRAELTITALTMAIQRQKPRLAWSIIRSRQPICRHDYRKVLDGAAMIQSMSRKGNCWDNAPMESCFGTIKTELVHHACYPTRELPGMTCSLTSKDITIVSGYIPPSGISLPNRQSAKPLDPVSTKSGKVTPHSHSVLAAQSSNGLEDGLEGPCAREARGIDGASDGGFIFGGPHGAIAVGDFALDDGGPQGSLGPVVGRLDFAGE